MLQENAGKTNNNERTIGTFKCIVKVSPIKFRVSPGALDKEKTISSMTGSLLEAYQIGRASCRERV